MLGSAVFSGAGKSSHLLMKNEIFGARAET
jgi:hypothetical protein